MAASDPQLARLLEHPAIWRARSAAAQPRGLPTGFAGLDERLPGRGWPGTGLIEILVPRFGSGELDLVLPALATLTRATTARWCGWVAPPLTPFAPALAARGVVLDRVVVVEGARTLWAFEQMLGSGACDAVLAWAGAPLRARLRRLQLAAERGRALGVLFRPLRDLRAPSAAVLRLGLAPAAGGVRLTLLKGRGKLRDAFYLDLRSAGTPGQCRE